MDSSKVKILTLKSTTGKGHYPKYLPKAFTEKRLIYVYAGCYIEKLYRNTNHVSPFIMRISFDSQQETQEFFVNLQSNENII